MCTVWALFIKYYIIRLHSVCTACYIAVTIMFSYLYHVMMLCHVIMTILSMLIAC